MGKMGDLAAQYRYLWNWLLDKGLFISSVIIYLFMFGIFAFCMVLLNFYLKWHSKH